MVKKNLVASIPPHAEFRAALNVALNEAEEAFNTDDLPNEGLSARFQEALERMSRSAEKASAAFTNIVTCLTIKVVMPEVDIRYHQVQIQKDTDRPAGFGFRNLSEVVIYPWLSDHTFDGAKSGWQTRTLERLKPYTLDYAENIGDVKEPFLTCFDEVEEQGQSAVLGLRYLLFLQVVSRESKHIRLSVPQTQDIALIVELFRQHFFHSYRARGASRLPVLALYAIYSVMMDELGRFQGKELKLLEEHSAADVQTGAVGDIEVVSTHNQSVFEAIEVKHNIPMSEKIVIDVEQKISTKKLDRYYILTTHANCEPDAQTMQRIRGIRTLYQCQIIANGVLPSLRYYLRLVTDPSQVFPRYVTLLQDDLAIAHEHLVVWNEITTGMVLS